MAFLKNHSNAVLTGSVALILIGAAFAGAAALAPAIQSQPPLGPHTPAFLSAYDESHAAPPRPNQPRVGLWLQIPDLQIDIPIQKGDGGNRIPYWTALVYPGTATPGAPGNSYLYGHGTWGTFGALLFAHPGAAVIIRDYDHHSQLVLHVTRIVGRIRWNDMSWIHASSTAPLLTMQTCVGANPTDDRWIVEAA